MLFHVNSLDPSAIWFTLAPPRLYLPHVSLTPAASSGRRSWEGRPGITTQPDSYTERRLEK